MEPGDEATLIHQYVLYFSLFPTSNGMVTCWEVGGCEGGGATAVGALTRGGADWVYG